MKSLYRKKLLKEFKKGTPKDIPSNLQSQSENSDIKNQINILIVDDEPSTLEFLTVVLNEEKFRTITARSVKQAISHLHSKTDITLIICDLFMPDKDGFVLLEYLKSNPQFRHIPVIISTSCAGEGHVKRTVELGIKEYINKPYTPEMILYRINKLLDSIYYNILFVSDDDVIYRVFERSIINKKYKIHQVPDGKQAIQFILENKINLIISELSLPDMTGLDLLASIHEAKQSIPILFLEDQQINIVEKDVIAAGGQGLITKPFNNLEINKKITEFLCSRRKI